VTAYVSEFMPRPAGYGTAHQKPCSSRGDCVIGVGFDTHQGNIVKFLVNLQYKTRFLPARYEQIARIDHNPTSHSGHDILTEGLHIDAKDHQGQWRKYRPQHTLPAKLGPVIRTSADYLNRNANFFVDLYEGNNASSSPPTNP
jgi:hypothetical protein